MGVDKKNPIFFVVHGIEFSNIWSGYSTNTYNLGGFSVCFVLKSPGGYLTSISEVFWDVGFESFSFVVSSFFLKFEVLVQHSSVKLVFWSPWCLRSRVLGFMWGLRISFRFSWCWLLHLQVVDWLDLGSLLWTSHVFFGFWVRSFFFLPVWGSGFFLFSD